MESYIFAVDKIAAGSMQGPIRVCKVSRGIGRVRGCLRGRPQLRNVRKLSSNADSRGAAATACTFGGFYCLQPRHVPWRVTVPFRLVAVSQYRHVDTWSMSCYSLHASNCALTICYAEFLIDPSNYHFFFLWSYTAVRINIRLPTVLGFFNTLRYLKRKLQVLKQTGER